MRSQLIFILVIHALSTNAATLNDSLILINKKHLLYNSTILDKFINSKGEKKKYITSVFNFKNVRYELEVTSPTTVQEFEKNKKNISSIILKSYQDQPSPYIGELTNIVTCSNKFTPKTLNVKNGSKDILIIQSLTGKDFNYGICEDKKISYSTCTSFYLDEKKSLYFKLKIFTKPIGNCVKATHEFFEGLTDL